MYKQWTADRIPDLTDKRIVITGGSGGLGLETAKALVAHHATVILAVRNLEKGHQAAAGLLREYPQTRVEVMHLDLADLQSIRTFADTFLQRYTSLDVLINNAGVMVPPLGRTKDGFELQFGSNHLGHFALTGLLLPVLLDTPSSRIVTLSSIAARTGYIYFNNLNAQIGYSALKFYGQSKLANLLFARELQKRLQETGASTISVAAHPGVANTNLISRGSGQQAGKAASFVWGLFSQTAELGALPTLYAAVEPSLRGGEYIGPDGKGSRKGYPQPDHSFEHKYNDSTASKLWRVSEEMTGVEYPFRQPEAVQE
ncbi:oxidoreductase [Paenibacillus campi]|uniref:oxidoreductase n=1 Tax=Paenibacillus campi TaxID=3106031 RepID=UPI002AFDCD01|nr:oxidoreductase [Paenibacillus sp. SGZ-1009]